jgi:hypothetical protein
VQGSVWRSCRTQSPLQRNGRGASSRNRFLTLEARRVSEERGWLEARNTVPLSPLNGRPPASNDRRFGALG